MSRFDFIQTPLSGLMLVQRKAIEGHRGFLLRFYCDEEFRAVGITKPIAEIFEDDLQTNNTETSIELNFAVLKFKHTIKKNK